MRKLYWDGMESDKTLHLMREHGNCAGDGNFLSIFVLLKSTKLY